MPTPTYWNPNGAPRVMSREAEQSLRQMELDAARRGPLSRSPIMPAATTASAEQQALAAALRAGA